MRLKAILATFAVVATAVPGVTKAQIGITAIPEDSCEEWVEDEEEDCQELYKDFQHHFRYAQAGDASAMRSVAKLLSEDGVVRSNIPAALHWLKRSAVAGDSASMLELAERYKIGGSGTPKSIPDMLEWYRRADAAGNTAATINWGQVYREGTLVPRDFARAAALFRRAAEAGAPLGMAKLAAAYQAGEGLPKSGRQAAAWYMKAHEAHPTWGLPMLTLAQMQLTDMPDMPADKAGAIRMYEFVVTHKFKKGKEDKYIFDHYDRMQANFALGYIYEMDKGSFRNIPRAVQYYDESFTTEGFIRAGGLLSKGDGIAKDEARAFEFFKRAMNNGSPLGSYFVGTAYRKGNGVAKNPVEARAAFKRAAEKGHAGGMADYGFSLSTGEGGPQDIPGALTWYRKSADAGNGLGANNYAWSLEQGRGGQPIDWAAVAKYYKLAVAKDHYGAALPLARLYTAGKGTPVDKTEAIRLLRLSKAKGIAIADVDAELAKLGAS